MPLPWTNTKIKYYGYVDCHPLLWAAAVGHEAGARFLLNRSEADVNARDSWGTTALHWAANGGSESIVKLLLSTQKVDVEAQDKFCVTPFMGAAAEGHTEVVKILLDLGKAQS